MKTIPATSAARWITYLFEIEAALKVAREGAVNTPAWTEFYNAGVSTTIIRNMLMTYAVCETGVEPIPAETIKEAA